MILSVAWVDWVTPIGVVLAVVSAIIALKQYLQTGRVQRAEFLSTLVRRFADEDVRSTLASIDSEDQGETWFENIEQDMDCRLKADAVFKFFASICYLLNRELIDNDEYVLFSDQMKDLLLNDNVKRYLVVDEDGVYKTRDLAIEFVKFGRRNQLKGYDNLVEEVKRINKVMTVRGENAMADVSRNSEECKRKVVLIRVSRLYREGMSIADILDITRGKWRANISVVADYKIAMAVVGGEIKGVFTVNEWKSAADNNTRVEFDGYPNTDVSLGRYIGKNISEMFPRGSANPIRYTTTEELDGIVKEVQ